MYKTECARMARCNLKLQAADNFEFSLKKIYKYRCINILAAYTYLRVRLGLKADDGKYKQWYKVDDEGQIEGDAPIGGHLQGPNQHEEDGARAQEGGQEEKSLVDNVGDGDVLIQLEIKKQILN